MVLPLNLRKRKISFFDLEKKLIPGLECLEDIIESRIKYVEDISNHVKLLKDFPLFFRSEKNLSKEIFCMTKEGLKELKDFLSPFSDAQVTRLESKDDQFLYKINFHNRISHDLCQYSSSERFIFYGTDVSTEITEINRKKGIFKIPSSRFNTDVPINYNKILIGPLNIRKEEFYKMLSDVGEVVSLRNTMLDAYFTFSFIDSDLNKSFVDVLSSRQEDSEKFPNVRYCYQDCIILKPNGFTGISFGTPLACSLKPTKVVFLINVDANIIELISERCRGVKISNVVYYNPYDKFKELPFKNPPVKIFIECDDVSSAETIYYNLGGYKANGKTIITGFFPEYNFQIGEYE